MSYIPPEWNAVVFVMGGSGSGGEVVYSTYFFEDIPLDLEISANLIIDIGIELEVSSGISILDVKLELDVVDLLFTNLLLELEVTEQLYLSNIPLELEVVDGLYFYDIPMELCIVETSSRSRSIIAQRIASTMETI